MPRGVDHGMAKLTDEDVRSIRVLARAGNSQRAIADRYGVHQANVWSIVHRKTWAHVK